MAEGKHGRYGCLVDIGQKYSLYARLLRTLHYKFPVLVVFSSVNMAVSIMLLLLAR